MGGSGSAIEERLDDLTRRIAQLEAKADRAPRRARVVPGPRLPRPIPRPAPLEQLRGRVASHHWGGFEDLLGGRVLAWVGGVAVLLGLALLFAVAVSNGWIGETARVALGAAASAGLLALGIWLHERKARTDAARAAVATGVAGAFLTLTVATQVYELLPSLLGALLAVAIGALVTALALRWESRGVAALGILGGLAAPVLAGADYDAGTVAILFVTLAAAALVLLRQRWAWLALAAFLLATPQWLLFLFELDSPLAVLATLACFGGLGVVLAVGHDVRALTERLAAPPAFLLALNAIVVGGAGWFALELLSEPTLAKLWLAALAVAHAAVGLAALRSAAGEEGASSEVAAGGARAGEGRPRISRDLGLLALTLGVLFADVAFALSVDGVLLTLGWTAAGVGFATLLRCSGRDEHARLLTGGGLGMHVALGLGTALTVDDTRAVLAGDETLSIAGLTATAMLAAGCLTSARIVGPARRVWRTLLDATGLLALALLTALALDGEVLALAWVVQALALTAVARRYEDRLAACGALGFLALAAAHALVYEAPPVALVTGLDQPLIAIASLAGLAGVALIAARRLPTLHPLQRPLLLGFAALALIYLASGLVVTPFESGDAVDSTLLSAHQQGQMVLSVFWALAGLGALVVGLHRDRAVLRWAGLALLGLSAAKVFLLDLATLTSVYRVVSVIGLGLLLLIGALVWQRLRPRDLQDLREAPAGVR
jgi:uncharacterized membrane protein